VRRPNGSPPRPLIAVVGPCAAGKSTLVRGLRQAGYNAREVAQEHSHVAALWQRFTHADILIYLDVSQSVAAQRRPYNADDRWWREALRRLDHARRHAHILIETDGLTPQQVLARALEGLERQGALLSRLDRSV
jgi:cytidylate kinase